ncbi:MAG: hypothetical protein PWP23_1978 [Candidatus Sumerlaeota bacterium]|nr:hypothetical protein [Candidatus Sumerlaeota bacterium]
MTDFFAQLLSKEYFGVAMWTWSLFMAQVLLIYIVARIITAVAVKRLEKFAAKTETKFDDHLLHLLRRTTPLGIVSLAVIIALFFLPDLTWQTKYNIWRVALGVFFIQVGWWATSYLDVWIRRMLGVFRVRDESARNAMGVLRFLALVTLWSLVALVILANLGVEIAPVIAGLGIGGIAIAFALQKILGDIFCSIAIVLDRPFEVGDFIIIGEELGSIERIGIKTTRIRSLGGEQIIVSNADLLDSRIRNYRRMQERRVVFPFGVLYQTPLEKLQKIPTIVKEIIEGIEKTRFDRAHFKRFADSALEFEVVYYVLDKDYNVYMDIQQEINLELFRRLKEEGVDFAYPTRTLFVHHETDEQEEEQ